MNNSLLLAGEFAKLCGISKGTLRFYRDYGLIEPSETAENGYAKYDPLQMTTIHLIRFMASCNWSLAEIKDFMQRRSVPRYAQMLRDLLEKQREELRRVELNVAQVGWLLEYAQLYQSGPAQFVIEERAQARHFLVSPYSYSESTVETRLAASLRNHVKYIERTLGFYEYPIGRIVRREDIYSGQAFKVKAFCSPISERELGLISEPDRVYTAPPGLSLRMWHRGNPLEPADAYARLTGYLSEHGCRISGDAWELWVMTQLSSPSLRDYVALIEIPVERLEAPPGGTHA